jgi:hypothetical protein
MAFGVNLEQAYVAFNIFDFDVDCGELNADGGNAFGVMDLGEYFAV